MLPNTCPYVKEVQKQLEGKVALAKKRKHVEQYDLTTRHLNSKTF